MARERVWDKARSEEIISVLGDERMKGLKQYDTDVIIGEQPYVAALSLYLSRGSKWIQVSSIDSPDIDLDALEGKKILVFHDSVLDNDKPRQVIEKYRGYVDHFGGFLYATAHPIGVFTFHELEEEYGNNGSDR